MPIIHASKPWFRFVILFFNCLLTFGSYFCFDMPSVLQDRFQNISCSQNETGNNTDGCCEDCLGMSPQDYNLLYAIYAWTNAVIVIGAGFFIDKLGNKVGAILFSSLCVIGSSTFAAGIFLRGTTALLPIMLIGRLLFGSGNGSLSIVQSRISAYWFKDKELAMAFGTTLAFSRLGSVLNFIVTVHFADRFGLTWTLWGGALLCGISFISAIVVGLLDDIGLRQREQNSSIQSDSRRLRFTDIKDFSLQFWLLVLTIMFFYNGIFPFVADASKFINDKYGYPHQEAAYMAGAVYYVSMVLSPILGYIIDVIGKRGILALLCALFTIPVFGLLAFSNVHPLVSTLWLGLTYSLAASSMWPSIPLVVKQSAIGTAMGLTTSVQMIGIGISNLSIGAILGKNEKEELNRWKYVMVFLLCNTILCIVTSFILNIVDKKRDKVLNQSKRERLTRQMLEDYQQHGESGQFADGHDPVETDPLLGPVHSNNRPTNIN